jgi:2-haloacid dehalogenase
MRPVVVFDVNETLLDLEPVRQEFERLFGDRSIASVWFATLLRLSFVATITKDYRPFTELGGAAFDMVAASRSLEASPVDRDTVVAAMRSLPAHRDSAPGLAMLEEAGFRLAALTNSPLDAAKDQLAAAGLDVHLERIMSVDMVEAFKPAATVYRSAAARLAVPINGMVMVAAHDWDVAGAMAAGCRGAFVARAGMVLSPVQPAPDIVGSDIEDVAAKIIAAWG